MCLIKDRELFVRYLAGKLLLAEEIPLNIECIEELVNRNQLQKTSSIIKRMFTTICQRCLNDDPLLFGQIPCAKCQQKHIYCRHCLQMGRVLACEYLYEWIGKQPVWPKHKNPCHWKGRLTKDQSAAAHRIVQGIIRREKELLLWAVTGAGKTEMLFPAITKSLQLGLRICIASPRVDVIRELSPRLKQAFPKVSLEALYGGSQDRLGQAQFILATTHQLLRFKAAFDVLFIDEIDAFPYTFDTTLEKTAKRSVKPSGTTIYLTATPKEDDERKMNNNTLPHIFIPRRFHNNPLPVPRLINCFNLSQHLKQGKLPKAFINWFKQRQKQYSKRQLLIFLPTIPLANQLAKKTKTFFTSFGQRVEAVHAEDEARLLKVEKFRKRRIDILMTTTILERGVTFPAIDVVVIDAGHEIFNRAALVQIAGRAGRHPIDPQGDVLFMHNGKTKAMVQAVHLIKRMNKLAGFQ